ncbi:putative ribonuclease H-like domain-containing protein [Tanacetum coccineum]|uniref:Ribonuclease H-like domain-containing protein n=1 Tax=Tanacetum coccineum TaxID=301880 RepID=A0ABQ5BHK6_9ASTR
MDLPKGKKAIDTKWIFRNKKYERGIVIRNKARLVAQGYTQEEGINYEEVFAPVARMKPSDWFEDPDYPDKVYKVVKALYGLHQALRAWSETLAKNLVFKMSGQLAHPEKPLLKNSDGDDVDVHLYSNYAGVSLDRKSTTGGCQFLGCRLISWQCKKQTVVATSSTEAEYVAAASCCGQDKQIEYLMLNASPLKHVKRGQDTKIPQSSSPLVKAGDEAVHKELGDRMERAATTASSLEAEQDSGNINRTQSMATLNEPSP